MSPVEFRNNNKSLLQSLKKQLESKGISITADFSDTNIPYLGSSMTNGKEGHYIKLDQRAFLSQEQTDLINEAFPLKIYKNNDVYSAQLLSISDYDWDDDRDWPPSISFLFVKNGSPMI